MVKKHIGNALSQEQRDLTTRAARSVYGSARRVKDRLEAVNDISGLNFWCTYFEASVGLIRVDRNWSGMKATLLLNPVCSTSLSVPKLFPTFCLTFLTAVSPSTPSTMPHTLTEKQRRDQMYVTSLTCLHSRVQY